MKFNIKTSVVALLVTVAIGIGLYLSTPDMDRAPESTFVLLDGSKKTTGDLKGKVTLVNYWASWCRECRVEHATLTALGRDPRVRLVGIAYKDEAAKSLAFLSDHGNPYVAVGQDVSGRVGIDWGVYGVPETFVIDRDGVIRHRHVGPITPQVMRDTLLPLLQRLGA